MSTEAVVPDLADTVERLRHHAHYFALVADQLDAAAHQDVARMHELDAEREEFETMHYPKVGDAEETEEGLSPDITILKDLLKGLTQLAEHEQAEQRTTEQWSRLNEGAVRSARTVQPPRVRAVEYPVYNSDPPQVDLRL